MFSVSRLKSHLIIQRLQTHFFHKSAFFDVCFIFLTFITSTILAVL